MDFETDYLIVGSGAVGLAFADTLLDETDAEIAIVDRHGKPGGHWNDAYSFVALHQPSAYYGVNSLPLGANRKDEAGVNAGLYELASGPEVSGYFERVMNQRLLPSGRVRYLPMTEYKGDGRCVSLLSGRETRIRARRRIVDATYYGTTVPATHTPKFEVGEGVRLVPPNALPDLWRQSGAPPSRFVVLGAGKTAMDAIVWLLGAGAEPDAITWIVPRDSWLLNRVKTQPGIEFFHETMGGQADQLDAMAAASDPDDLFLRLEACGVMVRIHPDVRPSMFHYATMSLGEVEQLRRVGDVVRKGRVRSVARGQLRLEQGDLETPPDALHIDCTASAVERRPTIPVFQDGLITLQMIRIPQPAFSAALAARLEAAYSDDTTRNALAMPVPLPDGIEQFPRTAMANMINQFQWNQDKALRAWITNCRLDGFGKVIAAVEPTDADKLAILKRFASAAPAAMAGLARLSAHDG